MQSTYGKRTTQVVQIRSAFREVLNLKLCELTLHGSSGGG